MIKKSLKTLIWHPIIFLGFIPVVVLAIFHNILILLVFKFGGAHTNAFYDMIIDIRNYIDSSMFSYLLSGVLIFCIWLPAFLYYIYLVCKGKNPKRWFFAGLKKYALNIGAICMLLTFLAVVIWKYIAPCFINYSYDSLNLILQSILLLPASIMFIAIVVEGKFKIALKNSFLIGRKYFYKLLLPYVVFLLINFSLLLVEINAISLFNALGIVVSIFNVIYLSFLFTYSMHLYLDTTRQDEPLEAQEQSKGISDTKIIIIALLAIPLIVSTIYYAPKLQILYKAEKEFGDEELFQDLSFDIDYFRYEGKLIEIQENGISIKIPIDDNDSGEFSIEHDNCCATYTGERYEVTFIEIDALSAQNDKIECNNEFFLTYESSKIIKTYENSYTIELINFLYLLEDLDFDKDRHTLEYIYGRYELKSMFLSKWGPKYIKDFLGGNYSSVGMFNDDLEEQDNYGVISIILFDNGERLRDYVYYLIQVKNTSGESFSKDEAVFIIESLEVDSE